MRKCNYHVNIRYVVCSCGPQIQDKRNLRNISEAGGQCGGIQVYEVKAEIYMRNNKFSRVERTVVIWQFLLHG